MDSDNDDIYEDDAPPEQTFKKDLQDIVNNLTPARMFLPLVVIGSVVPARLGLKAPAKARFQRAQACRY